jgi:hypothetical protein
MASRAGGIGSAIGEAFAVKTSSVAINLNVRNEPGADTGRNWAEPAEKLAREAAQARANLEQALAGVAAALTTAATILEAGSNVLQQAAERESQATGEYIASQRLQAAN